MRRRNAGARRTRRRAPSRPSSWESPPGSSICTFSAQTAAARAGSRASSASMNVFAASNGSGTGWSIRDVRQLRGLLPYALVSALVVVASVVAIVVSTAGPSSGPTVGASATPSAAASATRQPVTDLSANGRLAYWRAEPNGDHLLWLTQADKPPRPSGAETDTPNSNTKTRWASDGNQIAYVEGGIRLVVVRVDGATTSYTLAPELRSDSYRIVDHRFSPSGTHIAATVQRQTGSQSDVYLAAPNGTWTRITTVEDAIAADWLDEDELLVQTTGGVISALRATGTNQFRPLTGLQASSPVTGGA